MHGSTLKNYVGGEWRNPTSGQWQEQRNPADLSDVTCRFPLSSREDARAAVHAASAALAAWSAMPPARRAERLAAALAVMATRRDDIAAVITRENGKTLAEAKAEIGSALREMEWQIAEGRRLYGETVPSDRDDVFAYAVRRPLGVVSVIAPWNFPLNVACRKCVPALMGGNTVVFKPASLTPRTGVAFVEAFEEAGLPPGALNLVTGGGTVVGEEFVTHPAIRAISFTGSTPVGMGIHRKAAATLARTQLEMGGKNPAVVLADADLDLAADAVALGAYACAGQWCTSTSRAIVEAAVAAPFTRKVLERVGRIRVGNGMDPASTMGPVCGEQQLDDILRYIGIGAGEGAALAAGGHRLEGGGLGRGCFIEPTVFTGVTPAMTIAREEIFGPVLSIIEVADFTEAVRVANDVEFGLSSSVFTTSLERALRFVEQTDVGLAHVNLHSAYKEAQLPFGGIKASGAGLPEAGRTGLEFFTQHKVAYVKFK